MQLSENLDVQLTAETDDIARIRDLLLGAEYQDLLALRKCLNNPDVFSQKISTVISEAISHRVTLDQSLSDALSPTIEEAIRKSIAKDPHVIATSLYPVMGPAIRKSISESLAQILENINQLLENSLSPRSIGWRIDAWRTGRNYSEIVLVNTLEYQVEQVFLIHNETSLLIQHVQADLALSKDPDIVSSMLAAIQDYIHDSFSVGENEALNSIRLGDLTVLIEKGPHAIIASAVRGKTPPDLHNLFKNKLEEIHRRWGQQLRQYSGNSGEFSVIEPSIRECLVFQSKDNRNPVGGKKPWKALIFIALVLSVGMYFLYKEYELDAWRNQALLNLKAEHGIVVIDSSIDANATLHVWGLRDPLSRDPGEIAHANLPEDLPISFQFEPYLSIDPEIIDKRIRVVLQAPDGVTLKLDGASLVVTGTAEVTWVDKLYDKWQSIHGVESLNVSALNAVDSVLNEINRLKDLVESTRFDFARADIDISDNAPELVLLADAIIELQDLASSRQQNIAIMVIGDTDHTGTDTINRRIAEQRATSVIEALTRRQVQRTVLQAYSLRDLPAFSDELQERRVVIKVAGLTDI